MAKDLNPIITDRIKERFWSKVDKSHGYGPNGDCWVWTGALHTDGMAKPYPASFLIGKNAYRASQVSLFIAGHPKASAEMCALHSCDNTLCVRPEHLRWGTRLENLQDYIERRPHKAALQEHEVRAIRASTDRNVVLAEIYGVTQACICNVRKRVTHKHII